MTDGITGGLIMKHAGKGNAGGKPDAEYGYAGKSSGWHSGGSEKRENANSRSGTGNAPAKRSLTEWVSTRFDIPADLVSGTGTVELRGRNNLTIRGCRRILKYSPTEMCFRMRGDCLTVRGKRLVCTSYLWGAVVIDGEVDSLSFDGGVTGA